MSPDAATAGAAPVALPKPSERIAILSLVLVFLCGAAAGALAMRITTRARTVTPPSSVSISSSASTSTPLAAPNMAEWKRQLNLSDDQTAQLTSILDDFSRYYDNVLADGNSRIMQILNAEQRRRFEQMLRQRKP